MKLNIDKVEVSSPLLEAALSPRDETKSERDGPKPRSVRHFSEQYCSSAEPKLVSPRVSNDELVLQQCEFAKKLVFEFDKPMLLQSDTQALDNPSGTDPSQSAATTETNDELGHN